MNRPTLKRTWMMLWASFIAITSMAQVTTVQVTESGTLWDALENQGVDISTVTDLKVTGPIDYTDFRFMRSMLPELVSVDLAGAVFSEVPSDAFREVANLRSCRLPINIERISDAAFFHCDALENLAFGQAAFETGVIVFPASLTSMGYGAFEHCLQLTSVDFSHCTDLGIEGFYQCSKLKEVVLPSTGNIRFGGNCFLETAIEQLTLTPAVNWLEWNSFPFTLRTLIVESKTAYNCSVNAFDSVDKSKLQIWVPQGTIRRFALADGWFNVNNLIKEYNVKVAIMGEGTLLDNATVLSNGNVFLHSDQTSLTAQPTEGYTLQSASFNGEALTINGNIITLPTTPTEGTLSVTFAPQAYTLTIQVTGDGTILRDGEAVGTSITLHHGEDVTFTLQPADGLSVQSILWNGEESVIQNGGLTYKTPVMTGDATLVVVFGDVATSDKIQMTVIAGEGGLVQYKGITLDATATILIGKNETAIFTFVPNTGMRMDKVFLNGTDVTSQVSALNLIVGGLSADAQLNVSFTSGTSYVVSNPDGGAIFDQIKAFGGNPRDVTHLTVNGTMNQTDWTIIKNVMNNLKEIDLTGTNITEVPENAFAGKTSLKTVKLPLSTIAFRVGAFNNSSIETIEGCNNIREIETNCFENAKLKHLPFGEQLTGLNGDWIFGGCMSLPETVVMPQSVRGLGARPFTCSSVHTLDLSRCTALESLGWLAAENIMTLTLPESGSCRLESQSLLNSGINELTLPASITYIGGNAMPSTLKRLYVQSTSPIDADQHAFDDVALDECILYVPSRCAKDYQVATGWASFLNIQEFGIQLTIHGAGTVKYKTQTLANGDAIYPTPGIATSIQFVPNTGYELGTVTLNGTPVTIGSDGTYIIDAALLTGNVEATFTSKSLTAELEIQGNGTVAINNLTYHTSTTLNVDGGTALQLTLTPDENNFVKQILLDGEEVPVLNGGTSFTTPVLADDTQIKIVFANDTEASTVANITLNQVGYGSVNYRGVTLESGDRITVIKGQDVTINFIYDGDSYIEAFLMNGEDVTAQVSDKAYTIERISDDITLDVSFFSTTRLVVDNPNGGELNNAIVAQGGNARTVTVLKINGKLATVDWTIIKNLMNNLEEIDLSGTDIVLIPDQAFSGKDKLKIVKLPVTVTQINGEAFAECISLTTIEGCHNIKNIGGSSFRNCSQLLNFPFGDKLSRIESWNTFENCQSLPRKLNLPASLTYLGGGAFNYPGIETVDLSACANLERIEHSSVGNAKCVILPETGSYALGGEALRWAQFTELILPANVNRIDGSVMPSTLKRLYVKATMPIDADQNAFSDVDVANCILFVPAGCTTDYQLTPGWSSILNIEEYGYKVNTDGHGVVILDGYSFKDGSVCFPTVGLATTLTIVPDAGYEIGSVKFNGAEVTLSADNTLTIEASQVTGTLELTFTNKQLEVAVNVTGNGAYVIDGQSYREAMTLPVSGGSIVNIQLVPDEGNFVKGITLNGEAQVLKNGGMEVTTPELDNNVAIDIVFSQDVSTVANVTFQQEGFGTVSYRGMSFEDGSTLTLDRGTNATLTVEPNGDSELTVFTVNGTDALANVVDNAYTLTDVMGNIVVNTAFYSPNQIAIDNPNGGELYDKMLAMGSNPRTVSTLKVTGRLTAADWSVITNVMSALEEIDLSGTDILEVPDNAFKDKSMLKSVKLSTTVTKIGSEAFRYCHELDNIEGFENVREIGEWAFNECNALNKFPFGNKLRVIRNGALCNCISLPETLVMPASVYSIGWDNTFNGSSIRYFDLSQCTFTESFCCNAFGEAISLKLPENGSYQMHGEALRYSKLTELIVPACIDYIGENVFPSTLRRLYVCHTSPSQVNLNDNPFYDVDVTQCMLYVPMGSAIAYSQANRWASFLNIMEVGYQLKTDGHGTVILDGCSYKDGSICFPTIGTAATFTIVPDVGYEIGQVKFNGVEMTLSADNTLTIDASQVTGTLELTFTNKQLEVAVNVTGNGAYVIDGHSYREAVTQAVSGGSIVSIQLVPDEGSFVKGITLNGEAQVLKNGGLELATPEMDDNVDIDIVFSSDASTVANVTFQQEGLGLVSYHGVPFEDGSTLTLDKGTNAMLTFEPYGDAELSAFAMNGTDALGNVVNNNYTLANVMGNVVVNTTFYSSNQITIDNPNGGELYDKMLAMGSNPRTVSILKVTGRLTAADWSVITNVMSALEGIDLSDTDILEVPDNAFKDKSMLKSVKLSTTVTRIGNEAFRYCRELAIMEGCDNVKEIGEWTFNECSALNTFPFGNQLQVIRNGALNNCISLPETLVMPASVYSIGWDNTFNGSSIRYFDLSQCTFTESFCCNAFGEATSLKLPENGSYQMHGEALRYSKLTELIVPACIDYIGENVFPSTLKRLYMRHASPSQVSLYDNPFYDVDVMQCVLYVPKGSAVAYSQANRWASFLNIKEYGLSVKVSEGGKLFAEGKTMKGDTFYFPSESSLTTFEIIPNNGWHCTEVALNDVPVDFDGNRFILANDQAEGKLSVSFAINQFDLQLNITGDGQVKLGDIVYSNGQIIKADSLSILNFTLEPSNGNMVSAISYNGQECAVQNGGTTYVTPIITANATLNITFDTEGELGNVVVYNVTTSEGGTVEYKNTTLLPETSINVPKSQDAVFVMKPAHNFILDEVLLNDVDVTTQVKDNQFNIKNVNNGGSLEVTFRVNADLTVIMEQPGSLNQILTAEQKQKVAKLTIIGPMDDNDFYTMRDELPLLSFVDLWDAECNNIPDGAFCISDQWDNETGKGTLTQMRLPEGIYRIGYRAFAGCTNLTEVNFEELTELNDIGGWAFTNTGLRHVDLSNTRITDLGDYQFRKARKIEYIALPITLININNAFQENISLTEIDLSNCTRLTNINDAFGGDKKLERVVLPEGLKTLNNTFNDCTALTSVNFPKSLEVIGDWSFYNTKITNADLKACTKLERIGDAAFHCCRQLANLTLPNNLQRIGGLAFSECDALTTVDMSQLSLTQIEGSLFCWCDNLESIKLPKTVITIRDNAFRGTKLSGILELPSSLTTIEHDAFSSTQITVIKSAATNPPALATENEDGENVFSNTVAAAFVPEGYANVYKETPVWEDLVILDKEVHAEVTVSQSGNLAIDIMEQAGVAPGLVTHLKVHGPLNTTDFAVMRSNMTLLYDLDLEDANISVIPENAFLDKKILMNVKLPASLLVIQDNAFKGCSALSGTLTLPSGVTTIGWAAFQGCTSLNSIVFNDALEVIRGYAFEGCNNLTQEITFPDNFTSLGYYAFANCRNLFGRVKFNPEFYMFMGSEGYWSETGRAFENCSSIEEVDLSECEYLYEIPSATFNECSSLAIVKLPPYLERIDDHAFMNCRSLTAIDFPSSLLVINYNAFNGCSSLRRVDISNCEEFGTIEGYAFSGCSSLETVNLPKSLNWIHEYAFNECRKLANLNVEALEPATLGEYVFRRVNTEKCVLSIPTGVYYDYLTAAQWGAFVQMRNAIDITLDEGATLSYSSNASIDDNGSSMSRTRRHAPRRAASTDQTGEAVVKDGTSLYVSDDESVTFFITPDENVSIKQVLFNGEDVTDQIIGNAYETPNVTEASSFKVLLNIDGDITVKELRMTETEVAIKVAESHQIAATVYPNNATNKNIIWTSSDENVASVSANGIVEGVSAGRANITARTEDGDFTQTCQIIVMSNDYYIKLNDAETFVDNLIQVPLMLHNADDAKSIQFDVYMSEGIAMDNEGNGDFGVCMSDRSNGHTVSASRRSDGSVRVIIYSNDGNSFYNNDGELLSLPITTRDQAGEFELAVKNIHITGPKSFDFTAPDYTVTIKVSDYPLGDSNGNGEVTITDVANTVEEILEHVPERFIRKAADANKDGIITVSDVTATVGIVLGWDDAAGSRTKAPYAIVQPQGFGIDVVTVTAGEKQTVAMRLTNTSCFTALQCDIFLPDGFTLNPKEIKSSSSVHFISADKVTSGAVRILMVSMDNDELSEATDGLLNLPLQASEDVMPGTHTLDIRNIRFVANDGITELIVPDVMSQLIVADPTSIDEQFMAGSVKVHVDGHHLYVEAKETQTLRLVSASGVVRLLHLQPGQNRFFVEVNGVYMLEGRKIFIK